MLSSRREPVCSRFILLFGQLFQSTLRKFSRKPDARYLSEFDHSWECAAKTSYGLPSSELSSHKIHIISDVRRSTCQSDRCTSSFFLFVGKTLLPISLGQLSLKTFQLPSGVESVSQSFGQTSIQSVLVILLISILCRIREQLTA